MKINIKKGLNLPIQGAVSDYAVRRPSIHPACIAICPDDFPGFVPKADVAAGDPVKAGQALLHHKNNPDLFLVTPVGGVVREVVRGERRKILRVIVDCASNAEAVASYSKPEMTADAVYGALAHSGILAEMRVRPYDIVPLNRVTYRDIFVSAFDSSPLGAETFADDSDIPVLAKAVLMLKTQTKGDVYISRRPGSLGEVPGAIMVDVTGPHPAGNVGAQIANIKPVNKGESVLTMDYATLLRVGQLASGKPVDWNNRISITGACLKEHYVVEAPVGCPVSALYNESMLTAKAAEKHVRIISGNVLTGVKVGEDGFMHWPYRQLTVIPEGDDVDQFMGWATLSPKELSVSPSFTGRWLRRLFNPDARLHGARRAMIMSGMYDDYLPMDIMLEYLVKAINANDIENMEKLGIYEIAPEDVALAEFVDSSKLPLQHIIRQGIESMRKENE